VCTFENYQQNELPRYFATDAVFFSIAQHCHELESISFEFGTFTDAGLVALAENCPVLSSFEMELDENEGEEENNITDAFLFAFAAHRKLERLVLDNCINITDAGISAVACCPLCALT